jgi:hypothetical protein
MMAKLKSRKVVTHSVRMEEPLYRAIKEEASTKSISFNNLVNQVLQKYVEFDRFVPKFQFMLFHKNLIISGLDGLSDDAISRAGESLGAPFAKDVLLTLGLPLNRDSFLFFVDTVLPLYKNFYSCQKLAAGDQLEFYLRHDLGRKWSLFLKSYISGAHRGVLGQDVSIEILDNGIRFKA